MVDGGSFADDIDRLAAKDFGYLRFGQVNGVVGELVGHQKQVFYCSNRSDRIIELNEGIYGLSNHLLDTAWPKVTKGKKRFKALLNAKNASNDDLFELLADQTLARDADLPATGIPFEAEKALSSIFIRTPHYGTRCSTIVKFDPDFAWTFEERVVEIGDPTLGNF